MSAESEIATPPPTQKPWIMASVGFWMSASGVDKSRLLEVGRDILLVTGYDRERRAMLLSVPPGVEPRRVSVDAIEHWMIYREHPSVGAILHVHGWMEGVPCTAFNYPCGTYELAKAVADMVREAEDPARAVHRQRARPAVHPAGRPKPRGNHGVSGLDPGSGRDVPAAAD